MFTLAQLIWLKSLLDGALLSRTHTTREAFLSANLFKNSYLFVFAPKHWLLRKPPCSIPISIVSQIQLAIRLQYNTHSWVMLSAPGKGELKRLIQNQWIRVEENMQHSWIMVSTPGISQESFPQRKIGPGYFVSQNQNLWEKLSIFFCAFYILASGSRGWPPGQADDMCIMFCQQHPNVICFISQHGTTLYILEFRMAMAELSWPSRKVSFGFIV